MKVTVCQMENRTKFFAQNWDCLVFHVQKNKSDLVLLPEMTFYPWFAVNKTFEPRVWDAAVKTHDRWEKRFPEMSPAVICGSRPVNREGRRFNEGFIWEEETGYRAVHTKTYLPNEEAYWEAQWYEAGDGRFEVVEAAGVRIGFAICTDLWFYHHHREYGRQGAHLLLCPRATPNGTLDKWLAGGQAAAVVSGAFCLSSNRANSFKDETDLGGEGWVIDPDGKVLTKTSKNQVFQTIEIDIEDAERAKSTYPRYVKESGLTYS